MTRPIQDVLEDMAKHARDNPTHGRDCACKDQFVSEIRRALTPETYNELALAYSYINRSPPIHYRGSLVENDQ